MTPSHRTAAPSHGHSHAAPPRGRSRQPGVACSCGDTDDHVVARRITADGYSVFLHSSGEIGSRFHIFGRLPLASMWACLELVCVCDIREISTLIREWKRARSRARATDASAGSEVFRRMDARAAQARAADRTSPAPAVAKEGDQ